MEFYVIALGNSRIQKKKKRQKKKTEKIFMMAWYKNIHTHAYKNTGDMYYVSFFLLFLFYFNLILLTASHYVTLSHSHTHSHTQIFIYI
jgi:hypothetical protein